MSRFLHVLPFVLGGCVLVVFLFGGVFVFGWLVFFDTSTNELLGGYCTAGFV